MSNTIEEIKARLKTICGNATQKRFTAWQGATGAGSAVLHTGEIEAVIDSHDKLIAALHDVLTSTDGPDLRDRVRAALAGVSK